MHVCIIYTVFIIFVVLIIFIILIIFVILIIFGPKNLPKLGKTIGNTMSSLREGMNAGKKKGKKGKKGKEPEVEE